MSHPPRYACPKEIQTMHTPETINQFLNLRAQGWSFPRFAHHLHAPNHPSYICFPIFLPSIFLPKSPGPHQQPSGRGTDAFHRVPNSSQNLGTVQFGSFLPASLRKSIIPILTVTNAD
jgi:hypothetical protein